MSGDVHVQFYEQRWGKFLALTRRLVCCANKKDAEEFLEQLKTRLNKFNLEVADDKTKIIKFGRKEWKNRKSHKEKTNSFTFLGFTHYLGTTRKGWFSVRHKTAKQNLQRKLTSLKEWLKQIRNMVPLRDWWPLIKAKLLGHYRYYGISGNYYSINQFYRQVISMVFKWINRRSQKKSMNWQQYLQYLSWNPLPKPKIYYQMYEAPLLCSNATLKSPVWENHQSSYNNVTNRLEFVQIISRNLVRSSPGKKFIYQVSATVNSTWKIIYAGIDNLLNQSGVKRNGKKNGKFL